MRVAFDARWYNDSGVGTYVAGLLGALAEHQQGCDLIVYEDARNPVPGLERCSLRRLSVRSQKYSIGEQFELAHRCRQDKVDLLHCPFFVVPYSTSCPIVVTFHDVIPFLFPIYSNSKRMLVQLGYRASARRAAHIIAVSQTTSRDLQRVLNVPERKISVVHNAVSRDHFHPHAAEWEIRALREKYGISSCFVVISTPRNWRTKNLATALKALSYVQAEFQIVAYGQGDGLDSLPDAADLKHRLIRTGFVRSDELGALFRHAKAFLLTSLYEGFGLPLLEAMSCGCPVVTSNGGSLGEIAGDGAHIFEATDAQGMAAAVRELIQNSASRGRWRARALRRAAQFSWCKAAEETLAVYRQACHASHEFKAEVYQS